MKVILTKDVQHVGRAGQTLSVKDGFARNFLLPRKLAIPKRSGSVLEQKHKEKIAELKAVKAEKARKEVFEKIDNLKINFQKAISAQGKLFGSISSIDISKKLKEKGFEIDRKFIQIDTPIKSLGEHKVKIDLGKDMLASIEVSVEKEEVKKEKKMSAFSKIAKAFSSKKEEKSPEDSKETSKEELQ